MALSLLQTETVERLIKPGMKVASFGYPDIIAPVKTEGLEIRKDSLAICKRHGLEPHDIPDAHSFFGLLGCSLDVFDVVDERGGEIYCDLNLPYPHRAPVYDMVLDVGTAEHCFNIAQALMNMADVVNEGGWIVHENPSNWGNHGFYNLNPTLFYDFYEQNGFQIEDLRLITRDGKWGTPDPVRRFKFPQEEVNVFCLAQRKVVQKLIYPVQSKYKGLIPAAGVSGETKGVVNG